MSYDADFATADPANAPLDPIILIGAEPTFWAAIALIVLAALLFGWWLGARAGAQRADAAHAIWNAVHEAARSAMAADDNALKGAAERLRQVIEQRLGKTLKLAGGMSGRIKKLDEAIAGQGPAQAAGGGGAVSPRPGTGESRDHAGGDSGREGQGGGGGGGAAAAAAATSVTVVTIGGPTAAPSAAAPAQPTTTRDLTQREQTDALRLAVAAFNEHWRHESTRVRELREAHAELSNPGTPSHGAKSGHGKVHGTRATH